MTILSGLLNDYSAVFLFVFALLILFFVLKFFVSIVFLLIKHFRHW